ncbi:hypothetical protein Bbelb_126030 [Branchiostoma belcheri]|nr:hypothetical protein Bbelb_126030 [Branchiostoma belcheri]
MAANRTKNRSYTQIYSKAIRILQQLFPRILTLQEYLEELISQRDVSVPPLLRDGDSQQYIDLLQTTLVGLGYKPLPHCVSFEQVSNQDEVLVRVIEKLCKSSKGPTKNVLSLGYRLARENSRSFSIKSPCIENVHPDDKIRNLEGRVWKILLSRIGDDVMTHLLGSCSLFLAASLGCYIQITGFPLYELHSDWRKVSIPEHAEGKTKAKTTSRTLKYTRGLLKKASSSIINKKPKEEHKKKIALHYVSKRQSLPKTNGQRLDSKRYNQDSKQREKELLDASKVQQRAERAKVLSAPYNVKRGLKRKDPEELHEVQNVVYKRRKIGHKEDANNGKAASKNICFSVGEVGEKAVSVDPAMPSCSHHLKVGQTRRQMSLDSHCHLHTEGTRASHESEIRVLDHGHTRQNTQLTDSLTPTVTSRTRNTRKRRKHHEKGDDREVERLRCDLSDTGKTQQGKRKRRRKKDIQDGAERTDLDGLPASNRGAQKLVEKVFLQDIQKNVHKPTNSTTATEPTLDQQQAQKHKINRTPRRYVKVQKLFVELLKRHKQCRYYYLVRYHCPISLETSEKQQAGKTGGSTDDAVENGDRHILEAPVFYRRPPDGTNKKKTAAVNHNDDIVQHQAVFHSSPQRTDGESLPISPRDELDPSDDRASQEFLMSQHSSVYQIYQLLRSILHKVVPENLWGSRHNKACFLNHVLTFLRMGRYERISLHQLMTGIRLNDCDWLKLDSNTQQEFQTRTALLHKFVWWLFNNFVINILRSYFYITETTTHKNQLLYYRSYVWKILKARATEQLLRRHMFSQVSQSTVKYLIRDQQCLGLAKLRFIPKKTGLRPIVNMNKQEKTEMNSSGTSINYKLQNLFKVLTYESTVADKIGASVFGTDDIYKKWKDFVIKHKAFGCTGPLYFVKVDIQHCFDSIPQDRLLEVMTKVLRDKSDYYIRYHYYRRYAQVTATEERVNCTFEKHVAVLEDFIPCFKKFVLHQNQTGKMYDAIAIDQVCQHYAQSAALLKQLKQHVKNNMIQIGRTYYRQISGISQGSRLSTLLCSFFYADMERRHLQGMDTDGLLLRLVDDFLLVTPHLNRATAFLYTMLDGIPEYGCSAHPDKVMTNFPVRYKDVDIVCQPAVTWFPWCGMLFHTQLLGVMKDYTNYENLRIRYTLTLDLHQTPGLNMKQKLLSTVKAKCHAFFLEPKVNSTAVIVQTLYKAFLFTAHQFHSYNTCLPYRHRAEDNPAFFLDFLDYVFTGMIMDICQYPLKLVNARVAKKDIMTWLNISRLCLQAFKSKLSPHRSVYFPLLKTLEKCLTNLERNLDCKELQQVTSQQSVEEFKSILD